MATHYEVHITRTPLGLGIHEEDTLVKVSGAMTGDEVITQGVRSGDILLKVSISIFTDAPCTRWYLPGGLPGVFDRGRVWGLLASPVAKAYVQFDVWFVVDILAQHDPSSTTHASRCHLPLFPIPALLSALSVPSSPLPCPPPPHTIPTDSSYSYIDRK